MMGNETSSRSPNPLVIILAVLLVAAVIWAIVASATVEKKKDEIVQLQKNMDELRAQAEQDKAEAQKIVADAELKRQTALKFLVQSQRMIQELQMKKVAAASSSTNTVKAAGAKSSKTAKAGAKTAKAGAKASKTHVKATPATAAVANE